jgi:stearoyl-CoA desaturase (delta-9 desaturase)
MPSPQTAPPPAAGFETRPARAAIDCRDRIAWSNAATLALMHLGCCGLFWVGWSPTAVGLASLSYVVRAFGLTAFYHRYFSHRAFRTSRWFQFVGALLGCLAMQKGPLWWAAHHRNHHRHSDRERDVHSPRVHGVVWAHLGWFLTPRNNELRTDSIRDWLRFPELVLLDRFAPLVAVVYAAVLWIVGEVLRVNAAGLRVHGAQLLVWGFFVSTVALYHATYSVNSVAHLFGARRYATADDSRNNLLVALLTLGEGWHNNHHHYASSARQGFFWWEIDVTFYLLLLLKRWGFVWDLRPVPQRARLASAAERKG